MGNILVSYLGKNIFNFLCYIVLATRYVCCVWLNSEQLCFVILQIPVMINALGGILVGLVTSHAGGVRKVNLTR